MLGPRSLRAEGNLKVGDKFRVLPPDSPDKPLEYEIAGVVSMDGWHWLSKDGLRIRSGGRTSGLMLTDYARNISDYGIKRIPYYWADIDGKYDEEKTKAEIKTIVAKYYDPSLAGRGRRRGGLPGGAMPGVAAVEGAAGGPPGMRGGDGPNISLITAESVREKIFNRANAIFWYLSSLPLITLGVTSIGIINTVLASIRARRWDMGILRALGIMRLDLFRLIVAEALLVGVAACVLSFAFGTLAGYCGTGLTRYINVRGGMVTPLVIPWTKLAIGFALTLGLCLLAALWPAFRTGRTEPLKLLQAGRAAM
ncbi:MAG: ABC transporter permease [Pirellulales bacterium]